MKSVVCFIPCCKSKLSSDKKIGTNNEITKKQISSKLFQLKKARKEIKKMASENENIYFAHNTLKTPALNLYKGAFYKQLNLRKIKKEIQSNKLRLFILSAGYGLVDTYEPLTNYEAQMEGNIARQWRANNLEEIICNTIITINPIQVFGFFAGSEKWSGSNAKYRYFFVEGLNRAIKKGLNLKLSGCFFRISGRGTNQILGSLGRTLTDLIKSNYSESFILDIEKNNRIDGTAVIGFKKQS